jgi:hypothetical protein
MSPPRGRGEGDELSLRLRPWDLFVGLAFDREHRDERDDPSERGRILEHERIPAGEEGVDARRGVQLTVENPQGFTDQTNEFLKRAEPRRDREREVGQRAGSPSSIARPQRVARAQLAAGPLVTSAQFAKLQRPDDFLCLTIRRLV